MPLRISIPDITNPSSTGFADEAVKSFREIADKASSGADLAAQRVPLANADETAKGVATDKAVTPFGLRLALGDIITDADEQAKGSVRFATEEEVLRMTFDKVAMTPYDAFLFRQVEIEMAWSKNTPGVYTWVVPRHVKGVEITVRGGTSGTDVDRVKSPRHRGGSSSFANLITAISDQVQTETRAVNPGTRFSITVGAAGAQGPRKKKRESYSYTTYVGGQYGTAHGARQVTRSGWRQVWKDGHPGRAGSVSIKYVNFTRESS